MRPLLITSAYPTTPNDPRGSFIRQLAVGLAAHGAQPVVVAPGRPDAAEREHVDGVDVYRARYARNPRRQQLASGLGGIVPSLRRRPWLIASIPALLRALRRTAVALAPRCDVVHAHWLYPGGIVGLAAAAAAGKPLVVTSHGGDVNLARRFPPLAWWARPVIERADMLLGVSHAVVAELHALKAPREKVRFLPLGVDVSDVAAEPPAPYHAFTAAPGVRLRVLFVGGLSRHKSPMTIIDAVARLQRDGIAVATAIIGDGPLRDRLEAGVARHGLRDTWIVGPRPPGEIATWMRGCDVLVLPSKREGRGLVLVEAMACSRAVIATDIPGPDELVVEDTTGFRFPAGDAGALAERLARLARDPDMTRRFGEAGRALVEAEGLLLDESIARHLALYDEVCAPVAATA